jgi:hypothetical protein
MVKILKKLHNMYQHIYTQYIWSDTYVMKEKHIKLQQPAGQKKISQGLDEYGWCVVLKVISQPSVQCRNRPCRGVDRGKRYSSLV